jgi:hypothetical protein
MINLEDYIKDWATRTERIVGGVMRRHRVVFSDNNSPNIEISTESGGGNTRINIAFRDSLRFVDMGAGRGYHKGQRINQGAYADSKTKGRTKKPIINRPIYSRIGVLKSVVQARVSEQILLEIK